MGGPPIWRAEPVLTKTVRFHCTSTMSQITLTNENVAGGVCGLVATAATTSVHIAKAFRLRKIAVWFCATAAGTYTSACIDWASSTTLDVFSPNSSLELSTMSIAEMVCLKGTPPKNSLVSFWVEPQETTGYITISCPAGSLIDMTVDYVINDAAAAVSGPTLSGATLGTMYHKNHPNLVVNQLNTIWLKHVQLLSTGRVPLNLEINRFMVYFSKADNSDDE